MIDNLRQIILENDANFVERISKCNDDIACLQSNLVESATSIADLVANVDILQMTNKAGDEKVVNAYKYCCTLYC